MTRGLALGGALLLLSGCKAVPDIAAAAAGIATGAATVNPAVAFAVGVGTHAAVNEAVRYYGRSMQHTEQVAIATAAAPLVEGKTATWAVHHTIPFSDEHGDLTVTRVFATPLTTCKELVFSVIDGSGPDAARSLYTTTICAEPKGWEWASAEPATARWGALQ